MSDSALFDHIDHEHMHLARLFQDVHRTFEAIASGSLVGEARIEAVESAAEDLRLALEEMLEHFAEEEEVLFVEIEESFPELGEKIAGLVANHEVICDQTRWIQSLLTRDAEAIDADAAKAVGVLDQLSDEVTRHSEAEQEVYQTALGQLPPQQRRRLLDALRSL